MTVSALTVVVALWRRWIRARLGTSFGDLNHGIGLGIKSTENVSASACNYEFSVDRNVGNCTLRNSACGNWLPVRT